ncbi:GNAT family N-acetyltransferase [Sulfitobacter sp. D35]|uniref:GNAT family N-acetyltransferase n=1 Tax=Sulfitobacter sp. D35 TaxID=3083252 RepID=UPI002970094F|nr:GNAT family N-acetyltransferase [Sulfitobacter sp. D35]MDW4496998.1 GNAT family N-acetyltransferase [Sulfitobacter sp. D35]
MGEVVIRRFVPGDRDWLVARHAALYTRDEGFDGSFGVLVGEVVDAFVADHDPACETGWIAEADGERLGSIFCVRLDPRTAKLRLFFLEPERRGQGLGRRLLDTCTDFARASGYSAMVLWTHESHRAAGRLYARSGWHLEATRPVHSFGVDNVEQHWTRDL